MEERMRLSSGSLLFIAAFCMLLALGFQSITLASQDYRGALLFAFLSMVLADVCCTLVFARGGRLRWAALALATPSCFILWDFLRRAPPAFGWFLNS
jgi:hypothetical protein